VPGPGSSGPILEWERQVKRKTMERPLPTTTGLEDLQDRLEGLRRRTVFYRERAGENEASRLAEELDVVAVTIQGAKSELGVAIDRLHAIEAIVGP
jgi:hypothetical protein